MNGLSELILQRTDALRKGLNWLNASKDSSVESSSSNGEASTSQVASGDHVYVPGLRNLGGNACFLNSSLQALASLPLFMPFLSSVSALSQSTQLEAPVTDALIDLFSQINTPSSSQRTLRPSLVIEALHETVPRQSAAILNADQQDAQELLVLVLAAVAEELQRMEKEVNEQGLSEEGFNSLNRHRSPVSLLNLF